jgi:hypothetical protein
MLVTGISGVRILSQVAYSQTDYEEYLIVETNTAQEPKQNNVGSGNSTNINCGTNIAGTHLPHPITTICPRVPDGGNGEGPESPTSDGEFSTTVVSNMAQIASTPRATAEVTCPEGTEITGGGHDLSRITDLGFGFVIEENEPTENGWKVTVLLDGLAGEELTAILTVYAVCGILVNGPT